MEGTSSADLAAHSLLSLFIFSLETLWRCFVFFLQREAERAASGETEVGGEDHGPVQSSGAQHATSSQQGQVLYIHLDTSLLVTQYET